MIKVKNVATIQTKQTAIPIFELLLFSFGMPCWISLIFKFLGDNISFWVLVWISSITELFDTAVSCWNCPLIISSALYSLTNIILDSLLLLIVGAIGKSIVPSSFAVIAETVGIYL